MTSLIKRMLRYCDTCHGILGTHDVYSHLISEARHKLQTNIERVRRSALSKAIADAACRELFKTNA